SSSDFFDPHLDYVPAPPPCSTRRSSDLASASSPACAHSIRAVSSRISRTCSTFSQEKRNRFTPSQPSPSRRLPPRPARQLPHPRSEEHTSELQSRENLVCRLLLEKTKQE